MFRFWNNSGGTFLGGARRIWMGPKIALEETQELMLIYPLSSTAETYEALIYDAS